VKEIFLDREIWRMLPLFSMARVWKFLAFKLNICQRKELAKVFLDTGKLVFIGSVAAYFIPVLADLGETVSFSTSVKGLLLSLTSIVTGVKLLEEVKE